jgi:outer membrane lipoprotein-sorting protein
MNKLIIVALLIITITVPGICKEKLTAFDILDKIDKNMVFNTAHSEVDMIITIKNRVITKSMVSYAEGNERSFIRFLSPARDKGTKILKINDIVKVYYPSAERVMRLSGHMLRRSMMGSDFSFEDMTERSKKMKEEYSGEIKEDEILNGRTCYVLELTSKIKKQTYFTRKIWVDKERFIGLKEELYARSGKFLKELIVDEVKSLNERFYPTRITMVDKLRKNSKTQMVVKKIEFDIEIPDETFSERRLMKK